MIFRRKRKTAKDEDAAQASSDVAKPSDGLASAKTSRREDALALLALLDGKYPDGPRSAAQDRRMRQAASRLIAQLEQKPLEDEPNGLGPQVRQIDQGATDPMPDSVDAGAQFRETLAAASARSLFSKSNPLSEATDAGTSPDIEDNRQHRHKMSEMVGPRGSRRKIGLLDQDEVRRVVSETVDQRTIDYEHPAVIALTLHGSPSREQAAALRALGRGQARAVHRNLRMLEMSA